MKILLSAYACEPNKGSEPGIGWSWAMELAKRPGIEVLVLTRANNKPVIDNELLKILPTQTNIQFFYYDLPWWILRIKKKLGSITLYYLLWSFFCRRIIVRTVREHDIDIFHHITFSSDWLPVFMPKNVDTIKIIGPLGGYSTNREIYKYLPLKSKIMDLRSKIIRKIGLLFKRFDLKNADLIIANNEVFKSEYLNVYPNANITCISSQLYIGKIENTSESNLREKKQQGGAINILIAGRFLYWKGYTVFLEVLYELEHRKIAFIADIVGSGDKYLEKVLRKHSNTLINKGVLTYTSTLPRNIFLEKLEKADVFLYPTFYGTGDSIMLEAIERGVPVVCFPSDGAVELLSSEYPYMTKNFTVKELSDVIGKVNKNSQMFLEYKKKILNIHSADFKIEKVINYYKSLFVERKIER